MPLPLRLRSTVLSGNRVEFTAPELPEGAEVEIMVALAKSPARSRLTVLDIVDARPPSQLTAEDWLRIEREFQDDRNSWDR